MRVSYIAEKVRKEKTNFLTLEVEKLSANQRICGSIPGEILNLKV